MIHFVANKTYSPSKDYKSIDELLRDNEDSLCISDEYLATGKKLSFAYGGDKPQYLMVASPTSVFFWVVGKVYGIDLSKRLKHYKDIIPKGGNHE